MRTSKKPRIVFLDAGTVDYGDVSLEAFKKSGELIVYDRTLPSELVPRCKDADIVLTNKCRFEANVFSQLTRLRLIAVAATGVNNINLEAAKKYKVAVANVSGYSTETVVQYTLAFILALAGNLVPLHHAAHDGRWSHSPFFMLKPGRVVEVYGKKLGIIGYGSIGRRVAQIAKAFGMKVLIANIPGRKYAKQKAVQRISFEKVVTESDFLTIHAPLTPLTKDLINAEVLRKMRRGAFVINMARGGIVNEQALRHALESGHLGGAATDVLTQEPPPHDHVLLGTPNLLMTPHIAWASREARERLIQEMALNIQDFLKGKKRNRVV